MSLRRRITLVGAAAVAVAVVLACTVAYVAVRGELLGQVDEQLRQQAGTIQRVSRAIGSPRRGRRPRDASGNPLPKRAVRWPTSKFALGRNHHATTSRRPARTGFPSDDVDREVATGRRQTALRDETAGDVRLRILTVSLGDGNGAVQSPGR